MKKRLNGLMALMLAAVMLVSLVPMREVKAATEYPVTVIKHDGTTEQTSISADYDANAEGAYQLPEDGDTYWLLAFTVKFNSSGHSEKSYSIITSFGDIWNEENLLKDYVNYDYCTIEDITITNISGKTNFVADFDETAYNDFEAERLNSVVLDFPADTEQINEKVAAVGFRIPHYDITGWTRWCVFSGAYSESREDTNGSITREEEYSFEQWKNWTKKIQADFSKSKIPVIAAKKTPIEYSIPVKAMNGESKDPLSFNVENEGERTLPTSVAADKWIFNYTSKAAVETQPVETQSIEVSEFSDVWNAVDEVAQTETFDCSSACLQAVCTGHDWSDNDGICKKCGEACSHSDESEWIEIVTPATYNSDGERIYSCPICDKVVKTEKIDKLPPTAAPTGTPTPSGTPAPSQTPLASMTPTATPATSQMPSGTAVPSVVATTIPTTTSESTANPTATPATSEMPLIIAPSATTSSNDSSALTKEEILENQNRTKKALSKKIKSNKNSNTISWNKVDGADGYTVYASKCSAVKKKATLKKVAEIKGGKKLTYKHTGLDSDTWYRYQVCAYQLVNGKKQEIGESTTLYALTQTGKSKFGNVKSIKLSSKSKITLKAGKKSKIKAEPCIKNGKKVCTYTKSFTYISSDKAVAKVNKKGKITAVARGTAEIVIIAHNGVKKTVNVTVK